MPTKEIQAACWHEARLWALCLSTSLRRVGMGVPVFFETRRNRSGERPLLTPLDVAAGRSPDRLRLLWVNPRTALSNPRTRRATQPNSEDATALSCSSNPAAGVGEGPAATSSGLSRGPSPTPAAGALATNPPRNRKSPRNLTIPRALDCCKYLVAGEGFAVASQLRWRSAWEPKAPRDTVTCFANPRPPGYEYGPGGRGFSMFPQC